MESPNTEDVTADSGVSIVEIVVSVLLLGLLAVAFLPFLTTALKISVANVATVSATEILSENLESLRHNAQSCASLEAKALELNGTHLTNQGQTIIVQNTVEYCEASAGTAQLRFVAQEQGVQIVEFSSMILIGVNS